MKLTQNIMFEEFKFKYSTSNFNSVCKKKNIAALVERAFFWVNFEKKNLKSRFSHMRTVTNRYGGCKM